MTMHTELYCDKLDELVPTKAIRAIHQAHIQLAAMARLAAAEGFDNKPALQALAECLRDAGHIGFDTKGARS